MAITYIIRMQERSKGGACSIEVLINKEILDLHNCPEMLIEGPYQRVKRFTIGRGKLDSSIMVGWGEGCGTGQWSSLLYSNRLFESTVLTSVARHVSKTCTGGNA